MPHLGPGFSLGKGLLLLSQGPSSDGQGSRPLRAWNVGQVQPALVAYRWSAQCWPWESALPRHGPFLTLTRRWVNRQLLEALVLSLCVLWQAVLRTRARKRRRTRLLEMRLRKRPREQRLALKQGGSLFGAFLCGHECFPLPWLILHVICHCPCLQMCHPKP